MGKIMVVVTAMVLVIAIAKRGMLGFGVWKFGGWSTQ